METGTTRRSALRLSGGAGLAALIATGFAGRGAALAQESSPAASPAAGDDLAGRYAVVRFR